MPRVKRGVIHTKKRRGVLKSTKGYRWGRKSTIKVAKTAMIKAGAYAYRDRRAKKRVNRQLWQVQLNAAAREYGLSYSKFINALRKANIGLDRKVLAELAKNHKQAFEKIIAKIK